MARSLLDSWDEAERVTDHLRHKDLGDDPLCLVLRLSPSTHFARRNRPIKGNAVGRRTSSV